MYPPKNNKANKSRYHRHTVSFPIVYGIICICIGLLILLVTYGPLLAMEWTYLIRHPGTTIVSNTPIVSEQHADIISPVDEQFGIVIPKIRANASVIASVDPYDSRIYQSALTKGVAHAKGSSLPGSPGNIFIFSHSSSNFYDALHYNSVFYLLHRLQKGDTIYLFFKKQKFTYVVDTTSLVAPNAISYMGAASPDETLTLMTCWPPGTTMKRLIIRAVRVL